MHFGGPSSARAEHATATRVTPPILDVESTWRGPVIAATIRVWADDDYRAQNVHWEATFADELAYANEVLAAQFGVRLVADYRVWSRQAPGATLAESLDELAAHDTGAGVIAVVGLTSSATLATATFEKQGLATVGGPHLVVRGYADAEERRGFTRAFPELPHDELERLFAARRRHQTAALLLHELGHVFGAPHGEDGTLMSAIYAHGAAGFDAASRATILAGLDRALHRAPIATRPASTPAPASAAHASVVIVVDADGAHRVGGAALDDATLAGLLQLSFDDDRDTVVVVRPAPGAPAPAVERAVALARAAGLAHVSIATP